VDYAIDAALKYYAEVIALNVILSYMTIFGPAVPQYMTELKQEALEPALATKNNLSAVSYIILEGFLPTFYCFNNPICITIYNSYCT
jgi:hypothetical protein